MFDQWSMDWCRDIFDRLHDGGVWAIPRSGMIFQKRGKLFTLIAQMPYDTDMPISAEQLARQQQDEFNNVQRHFRAAGIGVTRAMEDEKK